jgi:hypothetical protein
MKKKEKKPKPKESSYDLSKLTDDIGIVHAALRLAQRVLKRGRR